MSSVGDPVIAADAPRAPDPDLNRAPARRLLAIDWSRVKLAGEADALALWTQIAPTGDDWNDKLDELPPQVERELAIALLHGGNFTCMAPQPARDCVRPAFDVDAPAPTAGIADPCLRRLLAMWAIEQLEDVDLPKVLDTFRAIVAIPPPESQLLAAVLQALPESDHATRLELLAIAWRANQRDVVTAAVGKLDQTHLIEAATKHHIDGALEILSAEGHRAAYLGAVTDEALSAKVRTEAINDLVALDPLQIAPDIRAAVVKATSSKDCAVAASAARTLELHGDKQFVPRRPRNAAAFMRALCVLASYEQLQRADEPSLLQSFVPAKGLERIAIAYDALGEVDTDRAQRTIELVPRNEVVVPEVEDMVRALRRCTGTTCKSDDREYRFTIRDGFLVRLEILERPPCPR